MALKHFDRKNIMTLTESAVAQRSCRKLRKTTHTLRKTRGERQRVDCGRYYVVDTNLNAPLWQHVNLEAYALCAWRFAGARSCGFMKILLDGLLTPGSPGPVTTRQDQPRQAVLTATQQPGMQRPGQVIGAEKFL
jgi:hypothetical protein